MVRVGSLVLGGGVCLLLSVAPPARAEITSVGAVASNRVQAFSGVFADPIEEIQNPLTDFSSELETAPPGPFPSTARARLRATLESTASSLHAEAQLEASVEVPSVEEPPTVNLAASTASLFQLSFQVSGRASVSISITSTGPTLDAAGIACETPEGPFERNGTSASGNITIEDGSCSVFASVSLLRSEVVGDSNPGEQVGSFQVRVDVAELPPADGQGGQFVWIGGAAGDFADPENWDPEGVPTSADTALFSQGGTAAVDLAAAPSAFGGLLPRGVPVEVLLERTRVNLDPFRPTAGVLRLLSPSLSDPSLVVNSGGRLLLDAGAVAAQTAVVGEDGLGTVEVTGPNLFQTDGALVLGRDGEGRLHLTGGGNAISDKVVMGEGTAPGNALVFGSGSLWIVDSLRVSEREPSTVLITSQGELDSRQAFVDAAPQGELPNVTVEPDSTWRVDELEITGRGVVEVTGGSILPSNPAPGTLLVGRGRPGVGRLLVGPEGRVETLGDLRVGERGDGVLRIDAEQGPASVVVDGTLFGGVNSVDLADVVVTASIVHPTTHVRAGALEFLGGTMRLGHASRVEILGAGRIGRTGAPGFPRAADVLVEGNGPPDATRLEIQNLTVGEKGTVRMRDATLKASTCDIDAGGLIVGEGSENVLDCISGVLNHGTLTGRIRLAPGTNILGSSTGTVTIALAGASPAPAPAAAPVASDARAALLEARKKKPAPPPPPPDGLLEFLGDGEVGGTLVLQFQNGHAPRQGDVIEAVRAAGTLGGGFSQVEVRGLAPGFAFDATAGADAVRVTALTDGVPLPFVSIKGKPELKEKKKKAKLKLRREGDTSQPLLVQYAIRGTAKNGIDYELLPGTVEIRARKRSAKILLRPVRDGLFEDAETVEIEVLPGADYTPGAQATASLALLSDDPLVPEIKKPKKPKK